VSVSVVIVRVVVTETITETAAGRHVAVIGTIREMIAAIAIEIVIGIVSESEKEVVESGIVSEGGETAVVTTGITEEIETHGEKVIELNAGMANRRRRNKKHRRWRI
jgi:hypothetical protein